MAARDLAAAHEGLLGGQGLKPCDFEANYRLWMILESGCAPMFLHCNNSLNPKEAKLLERRYWET
jgi:hypothetical protein